MIRVITAAEKAAQFKTEVGPETVGKVLWYDKRDCVGIIEAQDGTEYQFSMGREGHIGISAPNYVTSAKGYVVERELVRFKPVDTLACDIRDYLETN